MASIRTRQGVDKILRISSGLANDIGDVDKVTIPVGVDIDRFVRREAMGRKPSSETVFGIVARLSPEKNIGYAIKLISKIPEARLVIVGEGPNRESLNRIIETNNVKNVTFVGYQNETEDYYNTFDAFLLTSKMEGTPISILEAMSCGLPIYTTGVGQIFNEFSHLENFHILNGDIEGDVEILRSQIDAPNYYQNLREFILENHDLKKVSSKFYESIADNLPVFEDIKKDATVLLGEYV
jgi:glycosyltransferase involved in cell wall biosynthesis